MPSRTGVARYFIRLEKREIYICIRRKKIQRQHSVIPTINEISLTPALFEKSTLLKRQQNESIKTLSKKSRQNKEERNSNKAYKYQRSSLSFDICIGIQSIHSICFGQRCGHARWGRRCGPAAHLTALPKLASRGAHRPRPPPAPRARSGVGRPQPLLAAWHFPRGARRGLLFRSFF